MKSFENPAPHSTEEQTPIPEVSPIDTEVSLRTAEHSGELSREDFYALIEHDFQDTLDDNAPIDDIFNPSHELFLIHELPKEERPDALKNFKEKLVRQRKAIASCRLAIERIIQFDNDVPRDQLVEVFEQYESSYGFPERISVIFRRVIDSYYRLRKKVLSVRAQFPDDRELVKTLTGIELDKNADCRIEIGPMSFDIYTDGMSAAAIYHKHKEVVPNFSTRGFSTRMSDTVPVLYNVMNMDPIVRWHAKDLDGSKTRIHEQEHQKNYVLRSVFDSSVRSSYKDTIEEYVGVPDPVFKREILEIAFSDEMINGYEKAKDEIIAILSSRPANYLINSTHGLFFAREIDAYDYLKEARENADLKEDALYNEVSKELLITEYKRVLTRGISAITALIKIGNYTNAEATALLTDKPLTEWPKTVRRLLAHNKANITSQNAP